MRLFFTAVFLLVFSALHAQQVRLSNYLVPAEGNAFTAKLIHTAGASFNADVSRKKHYALRNDSLLLSAVFRKKIDKKGRGEVQITDSRSGKKTGFILLADRFAKNKVIAHRGAWKTKELPENSVASLKEAVRLGCAGSEFDVHMTTDSVIVVNHDPEFMGMKIEESTYKQLLTKKHKNGEQIPTLEAYLKAGLKQQKTRLILEIKASKISRQRTIALTDKVLKTVSDLQAQAWTEYISFDDDALRHILAVTPEVKVQSLDGKMSPGQLKDDRFFGADYHFSVYRKQPSFIGEAHRLGLKINAWTVNEEADMKNMLQMGADYITTNEPERLFRVLSSPGAQ